MTRFKKLSLSIATFMAIASACSAIAYAECQIHENEQAVAEIRAPSELAALECLGRAHSRDRATQMEILRRTGRGQMAEVYGRNFIKSDFVLRLLELNRRAGDLAQELAPGDRAVLEAYVRGVNSESGAVWSQSPWTIQDTVLMLLLQSLDQTRRSFEQDILTDQQARRGYPLQMDFPWQTPILKEGEYPLAPQSRSVSHPPLYPFQPQDQATGSNSWVVAPRFTKKKTALLANDPHLMLKSPPFWKWVRILTPEQDVIGASLPGVPVVASGASQHVAWGLTNSYVDVADAVLTPREGLKTRKVRPWIWVKWGWFKLPFFFKSYEVVEGVDLPILPIESPESGKVLVLRWTGFDVKPAELAAAWKIMGARNVREMDERLSEMGLPSWNYVFADTQGGIGYRVVGRLPKRVNPQRGKLLEVRAEELGRFSILSADEAPHVLNPKRGWLATANQLQWTEKAQHSVGFHHSESFRGFRIEELLKEGLAPKHDVESLRALQCDSQAVDARFLLPVLLPRLQKSEITERLSRWNWSADFECRECALFRLWMKELGDPQWVYARATQGSSQSQELLFQEAQQALGRAVQRLKPFGGPWVRWGDVHRAVFPAVETQRPFALSDLEAGLSTFGDDHSVSPGSSDFFEGTGFAAFSHHSGPSQRMIVELSSPPRVHVVVPGSQPEREAWAQCRLQQVR